MSSPEMANFNHPLEGVTKTKNNFFYSKKALFLIFVLIAGLLFVTTIYREVAFPFLGSLTGRVVGVFSNSGDTSNYFLVSMNLTVPELELKDNYGKIIISGSSNLPVIIGDYEFSLKKDGFTQIILEDFSGKIGIDENGINYIDGKVMKATINGIPFSSKKGKTLSVSTGSVLNYEFVEFSPEIRFKKLNYVASGNIYWGNENLLRLNNENVEILNFVGIITFRNKIMNFEGVVENLKSKNFKLK